MPHTGESMDIDIADFALARAQKLGAGYAEVRMENIAEDSFILKNGNPEVSGFSRQHGISIRVLVGGSLGFATTNVLSKDSTVKMASNAVDMAKAGARIVKNKIQLSKEKAYVQSYEVKQKNKIADIPPEEKFAAIYEVEQSMPKDVSVPARIFFLNTLLQDKYYTNSDGAKIRSNIPRIQLYLVVTVAEGNDMEQAMLQYGKSRGWEYIKELDIVTKVTDQVRMLQKMIRQGKKAPKGELDIVCGSEVVGIAVHESCGHPYEADRILGREAAQAGESFVTSEMRGTKIGSELVTVIDDPTTDGTYGYYLFDDEGVKARPRELIKDGMIHEFLQNRETAAEMGTSSNASSRAQYYGVEPIVRMSNTYMKEGDHSFDELLEGVKLGVYINSFTEWNIDDKRYNQKYVGREAYLIENGKITTPVRRPILEITTPRFYSSVTAVGDKVERAAATCGKGEPSQGVPVDTGGPAIKLSRVVLGG